jgi:hypothetical protein
MSKYAALQRQLDSYRNDKHLNTHSINLETFMRNQCEKIRTLTNSVVKLFVVDYFIHSIRKRDMKYDLYKLNTLM